MEQEILIDNARKQSVLCDISCLNYRNSDRKKGVAWQSVSEEVNYISPVMVVLDGKRMLLKLAYIGLHGEVTVKIRWIQKRLCLDIRSVRVRLQEYHSLCHYHPFLQVINAIIQTIFKCHPATCCRRTLAAVRTLRWGIKSN